MSQTLKQKCLYILPVNLMLSHRVRKLYPFHVDLEWVEVSCLKSQNLQ